MGSSASVPQQQSVDMSEKYAAATKKQGASAMLAQLSGKAPASAAITKDQIASWEQDFKSKPINRLASTVMNKSDFVSALVNREACIRDQQVFSVTLSEENQVITDQKSSGRCWLFAMTNVIRLHMQKKYDLKDFQLSQSYLFFYDSLSKANYFLEQMLELADEDLDSRIVQHLFQSPENDGGQWDLAVNLVENFGLVPQAVYPESFNSSNTGKVDHFVTTKLREYALELREIYDAALASLEQLEGKTHADKAAIAVQSARKRKEEQMAEVYRILCITLGTPPKASDKFTWEYYTGEKKTRKFHSWTGTPLEFARDMAGADVGQSISLINDPRNEYGRLYTVDRLGNVVGGRPVLYVNTEVENLKKVAIDLLKADTPVWFGCDVGQSSSSALGILDTKLFDMDECFGTSSKMTKTQRIMTGDSAMTHAMVITAVHLDSKTNKPIRWRIENSWSKNAGSEGYLLMTDDWFTEHVFQIVADRRKVPGELRDVWQSQQGKEVVLPAWDPMGALARGRRADW